MGNVPTRFIFAGRSSTSQSHRMIKMTFVIDPTHQGGPKAKRSTAVQAEKKNAKAVSSPTSIFFDPEGEPVPRSSEAGAQILIYLIKIRWSSITGPEPRSTRSAPKILFFRFYSENNLRLCPLSKAMSDHNCSTLQLEYRYEVHILWVI